MKLNNTRCASLLLIAGFLLLGSGQTVAQEQEQTAQEQAQIEEIVVTGIRSSLASALQEKRSADNLVEVIQAEDIGKLPDQNLAEVLENVTGIQITRTAGIGTGVQIRGTNANRTEINGVSTVGSGSGRSGIDFEDVSAAMISAVEVVKASEAKTIEGSVGGTINLTTIRPLELTETLAHIRVQGEDSSLSTDSGLTPRISGTWGDNWSTGAGEFGAVISASYTEQDVSAFRPRADRDNFVPANHGGPSEEDFNYLPIQFFVQDYDNFEYETKNIASSLEWSPNDAVTLYFDAVINDQESRQESSRVQTSGVSSLKNDARITEFETVDFGTLDGENGSQDLGSIRAAVRGVIPAQNASRWDPNLRLSSDTNSRLTDSEIFRLGADWERGRFSGRVELSTSDSDSTTPSINTTLNFINPNTAIGSPNENGTPIVFDLTGGSLTFGIANSEANAPTTAQLLDPANYRLRDISVSRNIAENSEEAFRVDVTYDLDWSAITTVDFGYRYNETTSLRDEITSRVGLRRMVDAPPGNLFASILTAGPDNFDDADGRDLFVPDFLLIDPEQVASDQDSVLATLNNALATHHAVTGGSTPGSIDGGVNVPSSSSNAFFDISEETSALYAQANFSSGIFRGNIGLRYVDTDVASVGITTLDKVTKRTKTKSSYSFVLPRLNLVADIREDVVIRFGWGKDFRRPNFDDLSTSFTFRNSPNAAVALGNPGLVPEEVTSIDLSAEWYFAPDSVLSIGYFHKERTGLFVRKDEAPIEDEKGFRDITDPCETGGIFNPIADPNVFAPPLTPLGVCVPRSQKINGSGTTTQQGIEIAFQYDLSQFEDKLGWASGFGFIVNFTEQDFSGSDEFLRAFSRPTTVFNALGATDVVTLRMPLEDLSETAYNATVYYEKYGLSARMRYTWREAYRSTDFGSTSSFPWGFQVVQEDRGQLNASINYAVNDHFSVGLEGVNLTEEDVEQSCVNSGALLCYQGLTDRRVTIGASYRF